MPTKTADDLRDSLKMLLTREHLAKEKIHAMHSDMHMLKNKVRLEEELRESDRRIAFLQRLAENADSHNTADSSSQKLNGYKMWCKRDLSVAIAQRKIVELTALFVREGKLRIAYEQMERQEEAIVCEMRMGLLKEIIDRYTTLLPEPYLQECAQFVDQGQQDGDVVVRRSRGRQCRATISMENLSVDRFDDRQYRVELMINNEVVSDDLMTRPFVLKKYNSHVGAKLEFYVYDITDDDDTIIDDNNGTKKCINMAAFTVISSVQIDKARIFMEPRGHFDLTIQFASIDKGKELRRAMAITKARQQADIDTIIYQKHRMKESKSMVPIKCSLCHGMMFTYLKCRDCGQASHGKCAAKLVNECLPNAHGHKPTCLATFNLPHLFPTAPSKSTTMWDWCVHCGHHLWTSSRPFVKCSECRQCCHEDCLAYLPPHCGLSNKMKKALPLTASFDQIAQSHDTTASPLQKYDMLKTIGKGSFGKVVVAKHRPTGRLVAIKVLKKTDICKHHEQANVQTEFRILSLIKRYKDPFCIGLADVFQTRERVYFVSEFVSGGDLMYHIQQRPFTDAQVQFLAAQIVLGLDFLHKHGVIYRDLKLDNVLIDPDGYIKLADFGLSRDGMLGDGARTSTFCGTPEFMAPEIIKEEPYGKSVDWWAFGVCLYEMLAPFPGNSESDIYDAIFEHNLVFPDNISEAGRDLINKCLELDPTKRIGSGPQDADELKRHAFFAKVDFGKLHDKRLPAPFLPPANHHDIAVNFDPEFTVQPTALSPIASADLVNIGEIKM